MICPRLYYYMGFPHAGGAIPCCFFNSRVQTVESSCSPVLYVSRLKGSIGYLTSQGETTCREKDALGKLLETER